MTPSEERAHRALLAQARAWRAHLIKGTSTSTWSATLSLLSAIAEFEPPCPHDRDWRVFKPEAYGTVGQTCGRCGQALGPAPVATETPL